MKRLYFITVALIISTFLQAQDSINRKGMHGLKFTSYTSFGVLEGESSAAFLFQSVNGVYYKGWFAGIGVGVDDYRFRSIPLFFDVKKDLLKQKPIYVYADAGTNLPWVKKYDATLLPVPEYKKGWYHDIGLGYRLYFSTNNAAVVSAGWSGKRITEVHKQTGPCIFPPCAVQESEYNYSLRSLTFKLGVSF